MASSTIYFQNIKELTPFFEKAAAGESTAFDVLIASLNTAPNSASQWVSSTSAAWSIAAETILQGVTPGTTLTENQRRFLKALLSSGVDSELLRRHYKYLFQEEFPNCSNPDAILDSLGFYNSGKSLTDVADSLRVYQAIIVGATCWNLIDCKLGEITDFNESTGTIKYTRDGKEKTVKLSAFTKSEAVIVPGSTMDKLIKKEKLSFNSEDDLLAEAKNGIILRAGGTALSKVKEILIPAIYDQKEFKKICTPEIQTSSRWDDSRSMQELEKRLETEAALVVKFQKTYVDAVDGLKKFVTAATKKPTGNFCETLAANTTETVALIDKNAQLLQELGDTDAAVEVKKAVDTLGTLKELLTTPQAANVSENGSASLQKTKAFLDLLATTIAAIKQLDGQDKEAKSALWDTSKVQLDNAKKECLAELEALKQEALSTGTFLDIFQADWEDKGGANVKALLEKELNRLKSELLSPSYSNSSNRDDRSKRLECWANAVSMLCKTPKCAKMVTDFLKDYLAKAAQELSEGDQKKDSDIVRRKCLAAFTEVTDGLSGKQVPVWMQLIETLAGEDFLIDGAMLMPFRLWAHAENILSAKDAKEAEHAKKEKGAKNSEGENAAEGEQEPKFEKKHLRHFQTRVFEDFKSGKPSADHYAWLWKNRKGTALKDNLEGIKASLSKNDRKTSSKDAGDLVARYLGDSDLLFKTLHRDLKGNYLKSQRDIRHLLLDDEEFQSWIMRQGNTAAIMNLVRCVNRLPLLDSSEKQSILVKIVRIYPEALSIVEESAATRQELERISSIHSMLRLQQELDKLVNEEIPANTAQIEDARSRGDLSENSEYKAAKERQAELNKKRAELQRNLEKCDFIDLAQRKFTGAVAPATVVTLRLENGAEQTTTLLGLYDYDREKGWISYDSPMGRVLMGHHLNDKVTTPAGVQGTIIQIERVSEEVLDFLRQ